MCFDRVKVVDRDGRYMPFARGEFCQGRGPEKNKHHDTIPDKNVMPEVVS